MSTVKTILSSLILAGAAGLAASAAAEVVVVVSAKSPAGNITSDQAADIFLGKLGAIPGAAAVVPIDLADGAARNEFYQKVAGRTQPQVKAYWSKQIFTGKGQPPREVADAGAAKAMLAGNPNLIAYFDKSAVDASVKVLLTVK